jgi:hypothetical protein
MLLDLGGSMKCGIGYRQHEHMRPEAVADICFSNMLVDCATLLAALPMVLTFEPMADL